ncbi:MAG: hypothetical protein JNL10_05375 [Verrucomicrobiales bacterium]|nr:hypothetical protein [Verrucomicrobiales bacterium]
MNARNGHRRMSAQGMGCRVGWALLLLAGWLQGRDSVSGAPADWFELEVMDAATGRGVPLISLRTVNQVRLWTDSAGRVAFLEPGMMNRDVFVFVEGDGYEFPKDGFGNAGLQVHPIPGRSRRIKVRRTDIAERLYRVTGEGIYRDSVLTGHAAPLREPLLNGGVTGQDTVIATLYGDRIFWFWGDTDRLSYPLGNFSASGATSALPGRGGLSPATGIHLDYFTGPDGFVAPMCPDFGPGLQWIESVFVLPDDSGRDRLLARVSSQKGLEPAYAWHLAVWNDARHQFEKRITWPLRDGHDSAHPFRATAHGIDYLFLYPDLRVPARWDAVTNLALYEAFTCFTDTGDVDREGSGSPRWQWRAGATRPGPAALHHAGIDPGTRDVETGATVELNRGSVNWNAYRKRWIRIASGEPGQIWYSEALSPTGPWETARRVVSQRAYNLYNPTQHSFFDEDGGRRIYFEGTYTAAFSSAGEKTPRYDYNQLLFRLDLADERLHLPAPRRPPLDPEPVIPRAASGR